MGVVDIGAGALVEIAELLPPTGLKRLKLPGFDGLVGIVDESEKVVYLPSVDHMRNRLRDLSADKFESIMNAYIQLGPQLERQGYQRRFILDH